ncbi:hypothetical protein NDU88_001787 [Pleurodeles waltl]|uniref:Uncharacterized protein n=1 Tax=Pleurodeles waltl TaxID=8319 RepID=A0AAV7UWC5_PLEWA|nr:hypothetical protein NDU88_001787 [Pleurodeles waltl]
MMRKNTVHRYVTALSVSADAEVLGALSRELHLFIHTCRVWNLLSSTENYPSSMRNLLLCNPDCWEPCGCVSPARAACGISCWSDGTCLELCSRVSHRQAYRHSVMDMGTGVGLPRAAKALASSVGGQARRPHRLGCRTVQEGSRCGDHVAPAPHGRVRPPKRGGRWVRSDPRRQMWRLVVLIIIVLRVVHS